MMTKIKLLMLIIFYLIISASAHAAGGIALGATRIIYPADAKQTAVWIRNSHTNERFLVNSWIENSSGVKEKSFIITPPLFVSEPKSENTLRIIYTGPPLAADRESLFWMNVKTIPSVDKNALNGRNVLQLAILSRMKLFLRPIQLQELPAEAPDTLKFSRSGNYIMFIIHHLFMSPWLTYKWAAKSWGMLWLHPELIHKFPYPQECRES